MAKINFPDSPNDGEPFDEFVWNSTNSAWDWNVVLPISYSFIGSYENVENTDVYTFNGIDAGGTGLIVLAFNGEGGTGVDASAVTVTSDEYSNIEASSAGLIEANASIWYAELLDPLNTTIDVTVNTAAAGLRATLGVWRINGYYSSIPIYADGTSEAGTTQSLTTYSLPENSVVIGAASEKDGAASQAFTWSGLTENYDTNTSEANSTFSGASTKVTSSGPLTVSATVSSGTGSRMAVAAWR